MLSIIALSLYLKKIVRKGAWPRCLFCGVSYKAWYIGLSLNEQRRSKMKLEHNEFWQTQARGDNDSEYQIYLSCANDGEGNDITTGKPLKTYEEWLNS